jgi:hypothetical protein
VQPQLTGRKMSIRTCLLLLLLLMPLLSYSAEFSTDRPGNISIVGRITKGDVENLRNVIRAQKYGLAIINLDSPGGDIAEAMNMAEMIKPLFVMTRVTPGKYCASACFFLWLVGTPRYAVPQELVQRLAKQGMSQAGGIVGLHRPYLANVDTVTNNQGQVMRQVQSYLETQMVPRRLIDLMMSRPSNDIYWLNSKDFQEFGEYRPDVEEFLISKCGYIRATESAMARGLSTDQMLKAITCSNDHLDQLRAKGLADFKK